MSKPVLYLMVGPPGDKLFNLDRYIEMFNARKLDKAVV